MELFFQAWKAAAALHNSVSHTRTLQATKGVGSDTWEECTRPKCGLYNHRTSKCPKKKNRNNVTQETVTLATTQQPRGQNHATASETPEQQWLNSDGLTTEEKKCRNNRPRHETLSPELPALPTPDPRRAEEEDYLTDKEKDELELKDNDPEYNREVLQLLSPLPWIDTASETHSQ